MPMDDQTTVLSIRRSSAARCGTRSRRLDQVPADERGDAIVAAMGLGGVDYMFFNSGSEIMFMQEAIAKANALGRPAPKLVMMTHEYPTLERGARLRGGERADGGDRRACRRRHAALRRAIHTARHSGLPVLITAGAPPVAYPGSMRGARDGSHFWVQQTADQDGIVRQYMKWDHRLEYQDNPGLIVSRAVQIAQSEPRGPVYLSLPREIAFLPADGRALPDGAAARHRARAGARSGRAARARRAPRQARATRRSWCSAPAATRRPCRRWCGSPNSSARRSARPRHAATNASR